MGKRAKVDYPSATAAEKQAQKEIEIYFLQNPAHAPSALLTIKSGSIFAKSAALDNDLIPAYSSASQVSSEVVKGVCSTLQEDLAEEVWLKLQKKHKDCKQDGNNSKIEQRIFYLMTGEKPSSALVCCSKKVLYALYWEEQRLSYPRPLRIKPDFDIDYQTDGVYKLSGIKLIGDESVYTTLVHISSVQVWPHFV